MTVKYDWFSPHLAPLFDPAAKADLLSKAARFLRDRAAIDGPFTLAGLGLSGALFLSPLVDMTGLPFAIVRKGRISDRHRRVECSGAIERYVIVDDFIVDGHTVSRIVRQVAARNARSRPVGIMLYSPAYAEDYPRLARRFGCWIKNVGTDGRIVFPARGDGLNHGNHGTTRK